MESTTPKPLAPRPKTTKNNRQEVYGGYLVAVYPMNPRALRVGEGGSGLTILNSCNPQPERSKARNSLALAGAIGR